MESSKSSLYSLDISPLTYIWCIGIFSPFCRLCFDFLCFLKLHSWHMEIPRLGFEFELQLPAYAIATQDGIQGMSATHTTPHGNTRSLIHWVRPGIWTHILMDANRVCNWLSHNGNSLFSLFLIDTFLKHLLKIFLIFLWSSLCLL